MALRGGLCQSSIEVLELRAVSQAIAAQLQGRTANQVMHHWVNHMSEVQHKKGKWNAEEDEALRKVRQP